MDTTSYWNDSASLPRFPKPNADVKVDVVVIGGGITGITTAYLMKHAGLTVALLERDRFARIDTGHTTAHLTSVTDLRLHQLVKTFGREAARAVWDAGAAAIDQIVTLIRAEDIKCDFGGFPAISIRRSEHQKTNTLKNCSEKPPPPPSWKSKEPTPKKFLRFPVPGIKFEHQAIFHPRKYLGSLLKAITGGGSHVFENTAADEILERPLAIKTEGKRLRCRHLVIATHNPLMGNTGTTAALLFQTKLSLYTSYALGAKLPPGELPEASFWDTGDPYYYLRIEHRRGHDYAIFGGEDHQNWPAR